MIRAANVKSSGRQETLHDLTTHFLAFRPGVDTDLGRLRDQVRYEFTSLDLPLPAILDRVIQILLFSFKNRESCPAGERTNASLGYLVVVSTYRRRNTKDSTFFQFLGKWDDVKIKKADLSFILRRRKFNW